MTLRTGQSLRGQGASQRVTDDDGREFVVAVGGIADSASTASSNAAPGAASGQASLPAGVVGGVYRVSGIVLLTGTAETLPLNLRLRQNGVEITRLPTSTGVAVPFLVERVTLGANGIIDVATVAAAAAGSQYTVVLAATRVE